MSRSKVSSETTRTNVLVSVANRRWLHRACLALDNVVCLFIHLSKNEWKRIVDYINIYIVTSLLLVIAGHDQRQVYRRSGQNGRKFALASGGRVEVVAFVFCLWHERKRFAGQHNHFLELAKAKTIKVIA